jgi:hypothetical protein
MPVLVSVAKIETNEGPLAVPDAALVHLLGVMVELVTIEMFCPRVTLSAALLGALELLLLALAASPTLPRGAFRVGRVCTISAIISIVQVEAVHVLVVRSAAGASSFLILQLLLDVFWRRGLLLWRHGLHSPRSRRRGFDFTGLGCENRSHVLLW